MSSALSKKCWCQHFCSDSRLIISKKCVDTPIFFMDPNSLAKIYFFCRVLIWRKNLCIWYAPSLITLKTLNLQCVSRFPFVFVTIILAVYLNVCSPDYLSSYNTTCLHRQLRTRLAFTAKAQHPRSQDPLSRERGWLRRRKRNNRRSFFFVYLAGKFNDYLTHRFRKALFLERFPSTLNTKLAFSNSPGSVLVTDECGR